MEHAETYEGETEATALAIALAGDFGQQLINQALKTMIQRLDDIEAARREDLERQVALQERLAVSLAVLAKEDVAEHWRLVEEVQSMKDELGRAGEERAAVGRQLWEALSQRDTATAHTDTMAQRAEIAERELVTVRSEQEAIRRRAINFEDRLAACEEARSADRVILEALRRDKDALTHRLAELQANWERLGSQA
ncbi:hypothetical protein DSUL_150101 [Desulfovibrionales bacterium]